MQHIVYRFLSPAALALCSALCSTFSAQVLAHGSIIVPESRVYNCFQNNPENPSDPACAAARDIAGPQAFYDWNGVNQANANGNHRAVVPDGQLCAGGNAKFAGLDLARHDWQATPLVPKADGTFDFIFRATAPHATQDWVFYVTHQGYSPNEPLAWGDLFEFCRLGSVPLEDGRYVLNCPLPPVSGKHVIYTTWQRSDSPEAFYTCTDVVLGDDGGPMSQWADEGPLRAFSDLMAGSTVALRLFNTSGNDIERIEYTVASDSAAAEWAFAFAQTVNSESAFARIGVLDPDTDTVEPVLSATANRVYTLADQNLNHEVDIQIPGGNTAPVAQASAQPNVVTGAGSAQLSAAGSSDADGDTLSYSWSILSGSGATLSASSGVNVQLNLADPAQNQTVRVQLRVSDGELSDTAVVEIDHRRSNSGGGDYDYVYPDAIGQYVVGETIVLGSDGYRYQCRPFPHGGWCNINSPYHYAPGTGANWQDAWIRL